MSLTGVGAEHGQTCMEFVLYALTYSIDPFKTKLKNVLFLSFSKVLHTNAESLYSHHKQREKERERGREREKGREREVSRGRRRDEVSV